MKINKKKFFVIWVAVLLFSCTSENDTEQTQDNNNSISIQSAWIREAPPNASALAGYLTIHNSSAKNRILTFAKSQQFNAIEIHRTIIEDGVAKMRRQDDLLIPAGGKLELKPGDFHLMLMSPKQQFKVNDEAIVTLCIKDGEKIEEFDVPMLIKKP